MCGALARLSRTVCSMGVNVVLKADTGRRCSTCQAKTPAGRSIFRLAA
jgi:hypothetical protein